MTRSGAPNAATIENLAVGQQRNPDTSAFDQIKVNIVDPLGELPW